MQQQLLHRAGQQRTYAVVLETGEEVMARLGQFAVAEKVSARANDGYRRARGRYADVFRLGKKDYLRIPVLEQVEVASLIGDIAEGPDGKPSIHVHLVVGRRDGTARAGHLAEGRVRPTLELIITENPAHLRKVKDEESGLPLIRPAA